MDLPPLSLELVRITPCQIIPGAPEPSPNEPVPTVAEPLPPIPSQFQLSPTSNYPSPFGFACLGERVKAHVRLTNTHSAGEPVRGVKMMLEIQSPTGRFRLGEIIHGAMEREEGSEPAQAEEGAWDELPKLSPGESVDIDAGHDIAELDQHILICSVAWETQEGRRTFQRFLKFNVNEPLAIKTRVHTPTHPNAVLSAKTRTDVYLEVLMQNLSPSAIALESVTLDPTRGLSARAVLPEDTPEHISPPDDPSEAPGATPRSLLPGDTTQRLFVLRPNNDDVPAADGDASLPFSSFMPTFATGTVLALGRLDIAWIAGPWRERGRFQTSTLNRRTPAAGPPSRPPSVLGTPNRSSLARGPPPPPKELWQFDLTVDGERSFPVEEEFTVPLRIAVRSSPSHSDLPPPPLQLGFQFLTAAPTPAAPAPQLAISPPSRSSTPLRPTPVRAGPPSPAPGAWPSVPATPSRPMTPVSQQLRHAAVTSLASPTAPSTPASAFTPTIAQPLTSTPSFPPAPVLERAAFPAQLKRNSALPPPQAGRAAPLGASLVLPPPGEWKLVRERAGTTYAAEAPGTTVHKRWEVQYDLPLRFLAMQEGLADLGGMRVLIVDEGCVSGGVAREWESLGDVWVTE